MKYTYFVSYNYKTKSGFGFGNTIAVITKMIKTIEDIREIEKKIKSTEGFDGKVIIMNVILLKKEEV